MSGCVYDVKPCDHNCRGCKYGIKISIEDVMLGDKFEYGEYDQLMIVFKKSGKILHCKDSENETHYFHIDDVLDDLNYYSEEDD